MSGKFGEDPIDECAVDIVAAEMGIAVGREHLEDAFLDAENRNIESAAAEVEHRDVAGRHLVEAVGERRGGRFVHEAHDFKAGEAAGVLGGLALAVVEVGGHGDYDALDFFVFVVAKRAFGALFERAQNFGGDLRGREDALADLKAHDRAAQIGEGVARAIFGRYFVAAESHIALDGSDDGAVFAAGKADCADAAVALDGQMRFHLDCALADGDDAIRRNRDDARQQRAALLADIEHARRAIFHSGDEAVGGAEVYAKNSCHLSSTGSIQTAGTYTHGHCRRSRWKKIHHPSSFH